LQKNGSGTVPARLVQPSGALDLNQAVDDFEKSLIIQAINESNGNYSKAARILNIPKQTLHNKIKKHNIRLKAASVEE
jgi:arginine utilization regulatory protein